ATVLPQERIAAAQTGRGKVVDDARRIGRPAADAGTERVEEAACRLRLHRGREVRPVGGVNEGCDIHRFTLAAVSKPHPPAHSPGGGGGKLVCSPSPLRGGGRGEGFGNNL